MEGTVFDLCTAQHSRQQAVEQKKHTALCFSCLSRAILDIVLGCLDFSSVFCCDTHMWHWSGEGEKKSSNKVEKGAFLYCNVSAQHISIHSPYAPKQNEDFLQATESRYYAIVHNRLYCDEGFHSVDNFRQVNIRTRSFHSLYH